MSVVANEHLCRYNPRMAGRPKDPEYVKTYMLRVRMTEADRKLIEEAARIRSLEMSTWARFELVAIARRILHEARSEQ